MRRWRVMHKRGRRPVLVNEEPGRCCVLFIEGRNQINIAHLMKAIDEQLISRVMIRPELLRETARYDTSQLMPSIQIQRTQQGESHPYLRSPLSRGHRN